MRRSASRTRWWAAAVAWLPLAPAILRAQSTDHLRPSERPVRWEIAGGLELGPLPDWLRDASPGTGVALALLAAARWQPQDSPVGVRAIGWLTRRRTGQGWMYDEQRQFKEVNDHSTTVFGLGIEGDVAIPLGRRATLSPSVGGGLVPFARGTGTISPSSSGSGERLSASGSGTFWSGGLALRIGHFLLEQKLIGIVGADEAVPEAREYYPILIGWRF